MSLFSPVGRSVGARLIAVLMVAGAMPLVAMPAQAAGLFNFGDQGSQDSKDTAQLTLRVQQLEQQVRDLTGQVQGLQFTLTQLQTQMQKTDDDNDFRFKQLEGGKPGNSGAVAPSDVQSPATKPARTASVAPAAAAGDDGGDNLGGSMDPLVGKGKPGASGTGVQLAPSIGTPAGPVVPAMRTASAGDAAATPAPAASANPAAAAAYKSAYDAIIKHNYSVAVDQLKAFIKQYPDDPQAADATNLLGEALLQEQDYVDAANTLVDGYKAYSSSPRAPDMLLKLGIALAGAQQQPAACKTFAGLAQKYPNTTTAFKTRLQQEMVKDKCPA